MTCSGSHGHYAATRTAPLPSLSLCLAPRRLCLLCPPPANPEDLLPIPAPHPQEETSPDPALCMAPTRVQPGHAGSWKSSRWERLHRKRAKAWCPLPPSAPSPSPLLLPQLLLGSTPELPVSGGATRPFPGSSEAAGCAGLGRAWGPWWGQDWNRRGDPRWGAGLGRARWTPPGPGAGPLWGRGAGLGALPRRARELISLGPVSS